MPFNSQKHEQQEPIPVPYPEDGMNNTAPAQFLPQNQAVAIENFYYDYASGYLRTRYPFRKYSGTILNASPVTGITKWNNKIYFVAGNNLFYLDGSKNARHIGTVGTEIPSFLPFHGYLLIASGVTPQYLTSGNTLTTITGTDVPTTLTQILEINQSVLGIGNTSYPDILFQSAVRDETVWSGGTSENYYLTYEEEPSTSLEDLTITGIAKGADGILLVSKRGGGKKATGYLDINETTPVWRTVSSNECARTWRAQCNVAGYQWIMDEFSPMAISGTDDYSKLKIDSGSLQIGSRIASSWVLDEYAFCFAYPPHGQLWYVPNISSDYIWVLHYLQGRWTRFKTTGGLRFYSSFYDASDSTLYLGSNFGDIYTYEIEGTGNYQDNPNGTNTDYSQTIKTAVFDPFPRNLCILKKPKLNFMSLADGDGTINFYKNYGADLIYDDFADVSFNISSTYPTMDDYSEETLAAHAEEQLWVSNVQEVSIPHKSPAVNTVQMELTVNSGAIMLKDINVDIAMGRKK